MQHSHQKLSPIETIIVYIIILISALTNSSCITEGYVTRFHVFTTSKRPVFTFVLLWWHKPLNLRDDNDKATKPTHFTCVGFSGMVGGNVNVLPKALPSVIDIECCVSRFGLLRILLSWSYIYLLLHTLSI